MALTTTAAPTNAPELCVVIAEDDAKWVEELTRAVRSLESWTLYQSGQFSLRIEACGTVACFQKTVAHFLDQGKLVYATLDLHMPLEDGDEVTDPQAGQRMIEWCLDKLETHPEYRNRLEFCFVSQQEVPLRRVATVMPQVKKIYKWSIQERAEWHLDALKIVDDIKVYLRSHLTHCHYRPNDDGDQKGGLVWFGRHEQFSRLLALADRIATNRTGGIYLLFSNTAGYEEYWAQLVCFLLGKRLEVWDVESTAYLRRRWDRHFRSPPEALMVSNIDAAFRNGCDILSAMRAHSFFEKIAQTDSLCFFHFPFCETQLSVSEKLQDQFERPLLDALLRRIYGEGPPFAKGVGFAFEAHPRLIVFPAYQTLRQTGAIRAYADHFAAENSRLYDCDDVPIDPEVVDVLERIDWGQNLGLRGLDNEIGRAYQDFKANHDQGSFLTVSNFILGIVPEAYHGALGFQIRARRLYRLLENEDGIEREADCREKEEPLAALRALHGIYDRLDRLLTLPDHSPEAIHLDRESSKYFNVLTNARSFLTFLFGSPQRLARRIEAFVPHANEKNWREHYPYLDSEEGRNAARHLQFAWPLTELPLHRSLKNYLEYNDISTVFTEDLSYLVDDQPDLHDRLEAVKREREQILAEAMRRHGDVASQT